MSVKVRVKVDGAESIVAALRLISENADAAILRCVKKTTVNVQRVARKLVPVDTGRLRSSILFKILESELDGVVFSEVQYAPFVEFGTSRQRAQPYLFPAVEINRLFYKTCIISEMRKAIS